MLSMSADQVKARITISIDPAVLTQVRSAVEERAAGSVSAFFEQAAIAYLDTDLAWERMLAEMLEETGGPLTAEEIAEADRLIDGDGR